MNRLYSLFCAASLILLALHLSACSDPEKLKALGPDATILAFGDSLTVGVGTEPAYSYPAIVAELTGMEVIGAGISGETTREGLDRFGEELEASEPDLVLLLEGGNDILRNRRSMEIKDNLRQMILMAHKQNVQVVLIGVPEKKLFSNSAALYGELADEFDLAYDGQVIGRLMRDASMKSDAIHFNQQGYYALAERVVDLLREEGAF